MVRAWICMIKKKNSLPLLFDYQGNGSYIRQDAVIPKIFHLTLSLLAATFSCLVITFYKLWNSLDPDQNRQNISSDLDPNGLTLW